MAENSMILEAQADFAVKLLREVSKGGESTILSPISVAIALSMVYAGAKDETAQEMNQLLANGAPEQKVHEYFGELVQAIHSGNKNYTLEVANKVYVKGGFPILDTFKTAIDRHYGGLFESVNFLEQAATAKKINGFVEQATHEKIKDLIKEDMMDEDTRLILVNAIYFKGNWADKFKSDRTEKKSFYVSEGNQKEVDMMQKTHKFIYSEHPTFQVLGMPYVGEDVFMFIVLPKERFGLGQVLANLTGKELVSLVQNRHKVEVIVSLPKFKLESTHELNDPLKHLGMAKAFSDGAQFNGITTEEPLKISQVVQKAFIEVNEEGTEAAAATAAIMTRFKSAMPMMPKLYFVADHPFAFVLVQRDNRFLFNGHFVNEEGTEAAAATGLIVANRALEIVEKPTFQADHPFALWLVSPHQQNQVLFNGIFRG